MNDPDDPNARPGLGFELPSIPGVSKALILTIVILYLFGFVFYPATSNMDTSLQINMDTTTTLKEKYEPALPLAINPHYYLRVWTIATAGFYEPGLFGVIVGALCVVLLGKQLELIWGSTEYLRFVLVTQLCSFGILWPFVTFLGPSHSTNVCGVAGLLTGFIVAQKQLNPEMELPLLSSLSLRLKHLPLIMVVVSTFFCLLGACWTLVLTLEGIIIPWVYLRFFQRRGEVVGDNSDEFAFHTFLPETIQSPIQNVEMLASNALSSFRRPQQGQAVGV